MRTTVRLDPQLLNAAKQHALETGSTLTALLEQALRETLARRAAPPRLRRPRLKTFDGGGLLPGISLDHSADLRDRMES